MRISTAYCFPCGDAIAKISRIGIIRRRGDHGTRDRGRPSIDLQTEDESGLPWGLIGEARDSSLIVEGRWIVVGNPATKAVAQVVEVQGSVVRVRIRPGPVTSHLDLLRHLA
jgi:hypothetical protein